jgi:hypothetical protein
MILIRMRKKLRKVRRVSKRSHIRKRELTEEEIRIRKSSHHIMMSTCMESGDTEKESL